MCTRVNIKSLLLPSFVYELNSSRHFQINMSFSVRHSKTKTSHTLHYHFIHSFHFHFHFQRQRFLEMSFRCATLWYVYGTLYVHMHVFITMFVNRLCSISPQTSVAPVQWQYIVACGTTIAHFSHIWYDDGGWLRLQATSQPTVKFEHYPCDMEN